jgi:hypothetical protein
MDSMRVVDREQLDQAADSLMASLRQSRDLNIKIRQAFLLKEEANASRAEAGNGSSASVLGILRDVISGASRP